MFGIQHALFSTDTAGHPKANEIGYNLPLLAVGFQKLIVNFDPEHIILRILLRFTTDIIQRLLSHVG